MGKRKKCIHLQNLKKGKIYGVKIQYKLILTRDSTHLPKKRPFLLSLIDPITSSEQVESTKNPAHAVECQVSRHSCGSNGDWQTGKVTQASQVGQRGKLCISRVCLFVCLLCLCIVWERASVLIVTFGIAEMILIWGKRACYSIIDRSLLCTTTVWSTEN